MARVNEASIRDPSGDAMFKWQWQGLFTRSGDEHGGAAVLLLYRGAHVERLLDDVASFRFLGDLQRDVFPTVVLHDQLRPFTNLVGKISYFISQGSDLMDWQQFRIFLGFLQ